MVVKCSHTPVVMDQICDGDFVFENIFLQKTEILGKGKNQMDHGAVLAECGEQICSIDLPVAVIRLVEKQILCRLGDMDAFYLAYIEDLYLDMISVVLINNICVFVVAKCIEDLSPKICHQKAVGQVVGGHRFFQFQTA